MWQLMKLGLSGTLKFYQQASEKASHMCCRWLLQNDPKFKDDNLIQVGDVFEHRPRVIAIGRPGYDVDKVYHLVQVAQSDLMYGTGALNYKLLLEVCAITLKINHIHHNSLLIFCQKWLKASVKSALSTYVDRFDKAASSAFIHLSF